MSTYQKKTPSTGSFTLTKTVSADGTINGNFSFKPHGDMMEIEEAVMDLMNTVGREVLTPSLASFDVVSSLVMLGGIKFYNRGLSPEVYQSIFGPIPVERHVYQSSLGDRTFVPLERKANLINDSTPHFAKVVSRKMANMPASAVETDFAENHRRPVDRNLLKTLTGSVGSLAHDMENFYSYQDPIDIKTTAVKTISVCLDGTTILFMDKNNKSSHKEALVGVIGLINAAGASLHTIYLGAALAYSQDNFFDRLDLELSRAKVRYPDAYVQGIADGAIANWTFLDSRTQSQTLDFFHLSTYVNKAADELFPKKICDREEWSEEWLLKIKYSNDGVEKLIDEIQQLKKTLKNPSDELEKVIVYLNNQKQKTHYIRDLSNNRPIWSGLTEEADQTLINQRMSGAQMLWKQHGATNISAIRSLVLSKDR
jgi:hypothetical protein